MDVSSSTQSNISNVQTEVLKKATEVQEQQVEKVLETSQEQSKEMSAQKTGIGSNLNITG